MRDVGRTFNIPDNEDTAIWGTTYPTLRGKYLDSLPNITGSANTWTYTGTTYRPNGAFYEYGTGAETYASGIQYNGLVIGFDASRSNNVYGRNGNTSRVYPARTAYIPIIKY